MPNNDFGFDFEYEKYLELKNNISSPVSNFIKEIFGELQNLEYTGRNYHSN